MMERVAGHAHLIICHFRKQAAVEQWRQWGRTAMASQAVQDRAFWAWRCTQYQGALDQLFHCCVLHQVGHTLEHRAVPWQAQRLMHQSWAALLAHQRARTGLHKGTAWYRSRHGLPALAVWRGVAGLLAQKQRQYCRALEWHRGRVALETCLQWVGVAGARQQGRRQAAWDRSEQEHMRRFHLARKWGMHWRRVARQRAERRRISPNRSRVIEPVTDLAHGSPERVTDAAYGSPELERSGRPPAVPTPLPRGAGKACGVRLELASCGRGMRGEVCTREALRGRPGPTAGEQPEQGQSEMAEITKRLKWLDELRCEHRREQADAAWLRCALDEGYSSQERTNAEKRLQELELRMHKFEGLWKAHKPEIRNLQSRIAELKSLPSSGVGACLEEEFDTPEEGKG